VSPRASTAARLAIGAGILAAVGGAAGLARGAWAQGAGVFAGQGYNEAAATRGQTAYAQACGRCHGAALAGGEFGPALTGAPFAGHWQGRGAGELLTYLQTRMPPAGPGTLPSDTYADLTAYILQANGAAPGAAGPPAPAPPPAPGAAAQAGGRRGDEPTAIVKDAEATRILDARKAKLDALSPVTDARLAAPPEGDWLMWRRTYGVSGFSPLKQIDRSNVARLVPAWSWTLPVSQNETTPLVHEGVMFVASAHAVQALDAATGDLLWQYLRPLAANLGAGQRNKALAIYGDTLIAPTADKHIVALNLHTGAVVWDHAVTAADLPGQADNLSPQLMGAPIVAHGKVVMGVSLGIDHPGGDFIVGLDARTGQELWRFNTIARPGQPGGDSWNGAPVNERYGAGVWTAASYDPKLNLVFFGAGNTYSAGTLLLPQPRKGESNDALYTDTTLALDPDTGKLAWHYQHMQRDVWDQDWVFEQTLATLPVDGQPREVVMTTGKLGIFDVMDRKTGQYLFSKDLGLQNLVTAIDPKTGKKTTDPALEPESGKPKLLCPGSAGARSWPTTSFDADSHVVYVPMIETCSEWTWTARPPEQVAKGGLDMRYPPRPRPNSDGKFGRVQAIDMATRQVLWTVRQRAPIAGSMLVTAGGLAFNGSIDRVFHAYDAKTGKLLWQTRLNASPSSSPITYAVNGEQYVAVISGGGGAFDSGARSFTPEIAAAAGGTTVVVFKLPKT
jgi:alcohol dehydrogenase (cytochrome c)